MLNQDFKEFIESLNDNRVSTETHAEGSTERRAQPALRFL